MNRRRLSNARPWPFPAKPREPTVRYIARSLDALGRVLRDEGKLAEAEKTYCEALTLLRERFGENHAEVAAS
jgi:hypothetical protein